MDVIKCVCGISKMLDSIEWPLLRIATLMTILKGNDFSPRCNFGVMMMIRGRSVLTYLNSLDYKPDIDNLSPVQVG
jgi:hypothetical protein